MSAVHDAWEGLSDGAKHLLDAVSIGLVFGTIVKMLPAVAAFLSIVWTAIRIWETETVRRWTGRDPGMKALRKLYQDAVEEPLSERERDTLKNLK